jgi:DNA repair protein RAD5
MNSTHIEERPHKKRRFFREDSSPVVQSIQKFSPPPASPEPSQGAATSPIEIPSDGEADQNGAIPDGFDVSLLYAVVGELPPSTVQKLKDQSDNDVQRGTAL